MAHISIIWRFSLRIVGEVEGGEIDHLEYDPDTKSAVITFAEPEGGVSYI